MRIEQLTNLTQALNNAEAALNGSAGAPVHNGRGRVERAAAASHGFSALDGGGFGSPRRGLRLEVQGLLPASSLGLPDDL